MRAAMAVAFTILGAPLVYPLLRWRVLPYGDFGGFHVPLRFLYRNALRAGDSFLWTPWLDSGIYIHGEGQIGMAHPAHLLLYRLAPLTAALNLEMLAAYVMAFAGMWRLLRRLGSGAEAAFCGALVFACGGYMLPHLNHLNAIAVAAHLPWMVICADRLAIRDRPASAFAALAALLGSQLLLGSPQGVWMSALVLGWFCAYRIATGTAVSRLAWIAGAMALGFAIGAAQVLPTLDSARESIRTTTDLAFRLSFSLHPANLAQLVAPTIFADGIYATAAEWQPHEFKVYAGALATLSAVWVAARRRRVAQPVLATAFLALALGGMLLALGRFGGVYPLLARLPLVSSFRGSARHLLIVDFALAGLVAVAVQDAMQNAGQRTGRWVVWVPSALAVITLAVFLMFHASLAAHGVRLTDGVPIAGVVFAVGTAVLFRGVARGARAAAPLLVILAATDLAASGLPLVYTERPRPVRELAPAIGNPPGSFAGDLVYPELNLLDIDKFPMWGRRTSFAYFGLMRSRALDPADRATQRLAGVRYAWTAGRWVAVEDPMPRARLLTSWRTTIAPAQDLRSIDVKQVALLDGPSGAATGPAGTIRFQRDEPGWIRIETDAVSRQLLIVTERFHAGWIASVDGSRVATERAYGEYLACFVPAGTHDVSFRFSPASWRHGVWLSAAGVLLTALTAAVMARRDSSAAS